MEGFITIDIERLATGRRGPRFVNAMVALGDTTLFRTKRGRLAMRIPVEKFDPALARLGVGRSPSYDGLEELVPMTGAGFLDTEEDGLCLS
jgi:hypothetical protein